MALTVFIPVLACFFAPVQKFGWWRTKKSGHRCKMMGIIPFLRLVVVDAEETFAFEKVPGLASGRSQPPKSRMIRKNGGKDFILRALHSRYRRSYSNSY